MREAGQPISARVRHAEPGDVVDIARLHAANSASPWPEDFWRQHISETPGSAAKAGMLYICRHECGNERAGPLIGFLLARRVTDEAEILAIAVEPSWRRQGVARRLISCLTTELRRDLPCRLFLEVSVENASALALYGQNGFIEVGTRKRYYAVPGRMPADAKILAQDLAN